MKLDINNHNLKKVAELIYETDAVILNFYFNNQQNAAKRIEKLVEAGNNSLGHEYVYIATDSDNHILGVLVAYTGNETHLISDLKAYFKNLNLLDALKFVFLEITDGTGADIDKDDYYLSDLAVDERCRGKGIGSFILGKSLELARIKGCKRIVLDVDFENEGALRLYKRFGFKIFNKKSKWFNKEKGVYNMEYKLS
ncbi:MAG: GNAT family N-acetyltransferase [Methanobacterium sp.]